MKERRIGTFRIPIELIRQWPAFARDILHDKLIVRAETKFAYNAVEYEAFCIQFEPTPNSDIPPYYDLQFVYAEIHDEEIKELAECEILPWDWSLIKCVF